MRQHAINLNYMCLAKSGFEQVLHMRLTVDMRLITRVYGIACVQIVAITSYVGSYMKFCSY